MKLDKLMNFDEWMRAERGDLYNELVMDYIHKYKRKLGRDNVALIMEDDTTYILPMKIEFNEFIKFLKENEIQIEDIKEIAEID